MQELNLMDSGVSAAEQRSKIWFPSEMKTFSPSALLQNCLNKQEVMQTTRCRPAKRGDKLFQSDVRDDAQLLPPAASNKYVELKTDFTVRVLSVKQDRVLEAEHTAERLNHSHSSADVGDGWTDSLYADAQNRTEPDNRTFVSRQEERLCKEQNVRKQGNREVFIILCFWLCWIKLFWSESH